MAVLLSVEDFQGMFGAIETPSPESQLKRPIGVALRRIKLWVGETVYNAAENADDDDPIREDLQFAAGNLAMHFLIANFNTVVRQGGIVKSEQVEGTTVLTYLSPTDTAARAQEFFDLADEITRQYRADSGLSGTIVVDEC
jgi:hypothetical protein